MNTSQMSNSPLNNSPYMIEMTRYLVSLAKVKTSKAGVNKALLNKESKPGRSYSDYNRAMQTLISEGVLKINDGCLCIGTISEAKWIKKGLEFGFREIWDIAKIIEPKSKILKKYDGTELAEIGKRGEEAVVEELRTKIDTRYHNEINHIALLDDTKGYDIQAPSINNHEDIRFLEVKTTVRPDNDFTFFLSRNEFEVGITNRFWTLVCVKILNGSSIIRGHLYLDHIIDLFPNETNDQAKWQVLKITIPMSKITPELP